MAFPAGWTRRCALVVQHGQVTANQTAFPVLITAACLPSEMVTSGGSNAAQSDGGDIRFSSDSAGASQLACEIVTWTQNATPASAKAEIWVPVNVLSATDATIYVWYNAGGGLTQPAANAAFGSQAVWDANYKGVWHFGTPSSLSLADSTGNNTLTNNGSVGVTSGYFGGGAANLSGSNYLSNSTATGVPSSGSITISCWASGPLPASFHCAFTVSSGGGSTGTLIAILHELAAGGDEFYAFAASGDRPTTYGPLTPNLPVLVEFVFNLSGGSIKMYVSGGLRTTYSGLSMSVPSAGIAIGMLATGSAGSWTGIIDECRVSNIERSADWIQTTYNNQVSAATFVIAGTPGGVTGTTSIAVAAATLTITTATPVVVRTGNTVLSPAAATLTLTPHSPTLSSTSTVSVTCHIAISPAYGTLTGIWLDLWVWRQLWHLDALTDTVAFLPVYRRALVMGLARELCREYGRDPAVVEQQADQAMAELEQSNVQIRTEGVKELEQS